MTLINPGLMTLINDSLWGSLTDTGELLRPTLIQNP